MENFAKIFEYKVLVEGEPRILQAAVMFQVVVEDPPEGFKGKLGRDGQYYRPVIEVTSVLDYFTYSFSFEWIPKDGETHKCDCEAITQKAYQWFSETDLREGICKDCVQGFKDAIIEAHPNSNLQLDLIEVLNGTTNSVSIPNTKTVH